MEIIFNKKKEVIEAKKVSQLGKFTGLMFRTKSTQNLLFEFKGQNALAIHSFFVFFKFLAIWLDENNNVLGHQIVKPFTSLVRPKEGARKLIEVPLNQKNADFIKIFVDKRKDLNIS